MPILELAQRRNLLHRKSDAQTVLKHVLSDVQLGRVAMVSSFGADSVVLLHMLSQIDKSVPVIFIDTLILFHETRTYQQEVAQLLGLENIKVISPDTGQLVTQDVDCLLHQTKPDACCSLRKTAPLERALEGYGCWISGRRRSQGGARSGLELFEREAGRLKVNPLAAWRKEDMQSYIEKHRLPRHPLVAKGYPSIGCRPCTSPVVAGEDERAGRWRGFAKTECGIHNGPKPRPV